MSVGYDNGDRRGSPAAGAQAGETPDLETLKEDVSQLAGAALQRGRHFLDSARLQATDYADKRKGDVAQSVADLAGSLREATQPFDDRPNIKAFADSAADGLEQLAEQIRGRSFGEIYADVEDVMRRRPAMVAAAGAVAGFVIARVLRASSENASRPYHEGGRFRDPYNPYVGPGVRRVRDDER